MGNKNFADTMAINRPDKQDDGLDAMFGASPQERPRKYANQPTDTKDGRKQITFKTKRPCFCTVFSFVKTAAVCLELSDGRTADGAWCCR